MVEEIGTTAMKTPTASFPPADKRMQFLMVKARNKMSLHFKPNYIRLVNDENNNDDREYDGDCSVTTPTSPMKDDQIPENNDDDLNTEKIQMLVHKFNPNARFSNSQDLLTRHAVWMEKKQEWIQQHLLERQQKFEEEVTFTPELHTSSMSWEIAKKKNMLEQLRLEQQELERENKRNQQRQTMQGTNLLNEFEARMGTLQGAPTKKSAKKNRPKKSQPNIAAPIKSGFVLAPDNESTFLSSVDISDAAIPKRTHHAPPLKSLKEKLKESPYNEITTETSKAKHLPSNKEKVGRDNTSAIDSKFMSELSSEFMSKKISTDDILDAADWFSRIMKEQQQQQQPEPVLAPRVPPPAFAMLRPISELPPPRLPQEKVVDIFAANGNVSNAIPPQQRFVPSYPSFNSFTSLSTTTTTTNTNLSPSTESDGASSFTITTTAAKIRFQLQDPRSFDSATITRQVDSVSSSVSYLVGKKRGNYDDKTGVLTIIFDREAFDEAAAQSWWKENKQRILQGM